MPQTPEHPSQDPSQQLQLTLTADDIKAGANETITFFAASLGARLVEISALVSVYTRTIHDLVEQLETLRLELADALSTDELADVIPMPAGRSAKEVLRDEDEDDVE